MNPCFIIDAQTNKVCRMASSLIKRKKKSSLSAAAATSALLPSGANALILPFSNVDSRPARLSLVPVFQLAVVLLVQRLAAGPGRAHVIFCRSGGAGGRRLRLLRQRAVPAEEMVDSRTLSPPAEETSCASPAPACPPGARPNAAAPPWHPIFI